MILPSHARLDDAGRVVELILPHPSGAPIEACFPALFVAMCRALTAEQAAVVRPGWSWDGAAFVAPEG